MINAAVTSSISSGNNMTANEIINPPSINASSTVGTFHNGTKCPSSNLLRTATTALTASTKSSTILT